MQRIADDLLASGASASTIRNALLPLRVIFGRALEDGEVVVNPCARLRIPAVRSRRERTASPQEAADLLAALPTRLRPVYACAFYAGLRAGELHALRWEDVDLAAGVIRVERSMDQSGVLVEPKSRNGKRRVPIVGALRDLLLEHKAATWSEGYVLGTAPAKPFTLSNVHRRAKLAWTKANDDREQRQEPPLAPIGLHEARHTFASLPIAAAVNAKAITTFLGHASIQTTFDLDGHLMPGGEAEAAELLDDYLERADTRRRLAAVCPDRARYLCAAEGNQPEKEGGVDGRRRRERDQQPRPPGHRGTLERRRAHRVPGLVDVADVSSAASMVAFWDRRFGRGIAAAVVGAASVAAVSGVVYGLRPVAPVLSLGVLYLFAILPVAVVWGLPAAFVVSVASLLVFNFFFLPPLHTFRLRDSENWVALAVDLGTALIVSELAARSRRRAAEAEQREREAAALAEVSALLLEAETVQGQLRAIGAQLAGVVGSSFGRIELGSLRRPAPHESAHELSVARRSVGRLFLERGVELSRSVRERMLPAVASVLAVADERERLARQALEAETLRRSDEIKTAVLRAVSHDLRSPLTAIRAAADGLASRSLRLSAADQRELLETIREETRRLDRLVANLLDLSRLEVGAAQPRPELWTVDTLLASALAELGADAARVDLRFSPDVPPVRVDGAQIERVLVNLLENALKLTPAPGRVEVMASSQEGEVTVRIVDRGPGLGRGEAERIFEPFERGAAGGGGTGLGLAIARGFAQANGSRLWAEPHPGAGAVFALALPAAVEVVGASS